MIRHLIMHVQKALYELRETYSRFLQIERNVTVLALFLVIMNQTKLHLVHNQKENHTLRSYSFKFEKNLKYISLSEYVNIYISVNN